MFEITAMENTCTVLNHSSGEYELFGITLMENMHYLK